MRRVKRTPVSPPSPLTNKVMVLSGDPGQLKAALRLLRSKKSAADSERVKMALKLLDMVEKFVRMNGRFKRPYTRRKKRKLQK